MDKKKILIVVGVLAGLGIAYFLYNTFFYVSTDNAQIQARTLMIAAKVPGYVTKVNFDENQKVKKGEVLVAIDPRDYENNLKQISGEMESIQARAHEADVNFKRVSDLFSKGAVAQQQYDTAKAVHDELNHRLESIQSQVDQAKLNLEYTEIKAPEDGFVAKKSAEVGMLANSGAPLIGFISNQERWITANFKETELKDIKTGKKVEIEVDSLPGESFSGSVESIGAATGATFTLLPPDNATGNFTKVVQRVPVRIKFENLKPQDFDRLQAGLSVEVRIKK
jgi:membrane fusion protein (multidrug efflux system)